ncbi:MAG: hypothetical protein JNM57_07095 [Cyclobacteriaceae bacterium]|nr:hypothetical protein [Cyclobacteriaceae bacterium]
MQEENNYLTHEARRRISYGSIIGGALVGLVLMILLNMFGVGLGLSTIDVQAENNPAQGIGLGAIIWYIVSGLIALFAAGWVAGRLAQTPRLFDGAMHGVLSWCIITLVSMYFVTTAIGSLLGGAGRLVGGTLSAVGKAGAKAMEMAAPALKDKAEEMDLTTLRQGGSTGEAIEMFKKADGDPAKVSKDDLTTLIMKSKDISRKEAAGKADTLMIKYEEASAKWKVKKEEIKAKAEKTADDVAAATSTAFIVLFFVVMLGGLAAWVGARLGTQSKHNIYYQKE